MRKRILSLFLGLFFCFMLVGCKKPQANAIDTKLTRYIIDETITPMEPELIYKYSQEQYISYTYYLGRVKDVPLSYDASSYYNGLSDIIITYGESSVTENSISESETNCLTNTTSKLEIDTWSSSLDIKIDIGGGSEKGNILKKLFNVNFEFVGSHQHNGGVETTTTEERSYSNSYSTINSFINEKSTTRQYVINSNYEANKYYRVTLFGNCDIYIHCVYDSDKKELYMEYEQCPIIKSLNYYIDVSDNNDFSCTKSSQEKLGFDSSILLESDIFNYSKEPNDSIKENIQNLYSKSQSSSLSSSKYGAGCSDEIIDKLELNDYSEYFKNNYLFCFYIKLEANSDGNGQVGVYLYDNIKDKSSKLEYYDAKTNGLIEGAKIKVDSQKKEYIVRFYIKGDNIKNTMYLYYSKENDKKCYKHSINVDLIIVEEKTINTEFYKNDDKYEIKQNGYFGLEYRSYDTLDLSSYQDKIDSKYLFNFNISINLNEKNDGYQEIYLYNEYNQTSKEKNQNQAIELGLIDEMIIEHNPGKTDKNAEDYNFNWSITGDKIIDKNKLYIRYDAYGNDNDTWERNSINIELRIYQINVPNYYYDDYCENDNKVQYIIMSE
ncbi:MAG: hypothetical protein IJX17_04820 [Clostridia bacterium]|nr:hypothetical protein [Clostridia bacterium]